MATEASDSQFSTEVFSMALSAEPQPSASAAEVFSNDPNFNITPLHCPLFWEDAAAKYFCNICKKAFYNGVALQNHRNMQHDASDENRVDLDPFSNCAKDDPLDQGGAGCGFVFVGGGGSAGGVRRRLHLSDTTYVVVRCEAAAEAVDALKRRRLEGLVRRTHLKPRQPVDLRGPFTCTFPAAPRPELPCGRTFFDCCEYSLHYRAEHTKRRKAALRCQVCERPLERARGPLSCRACDASFAAGGAFREHNRLVHAKAKPHRCSICAKRFTQQGGLQQHIRTHAGLRPFGCTFCPKAFTQKAGLEQHLRTHTKVKPFGCVVCGKSFSQSVHLRQHMRTHTNIQPFQCARCPRRFKQSSHLKFHARSHAHLAGALAELSPLSLQ